MIHNSVTRALRAIGTPTAIDALESCLEHWNNHVREQACVELRHLAEDGDRRVADKVPAIAQRLRDPSWTTRREAVRALLAMGGEEAVAAARRAADDEHSDVREAAAVPAVGVSEDPGAPGGRDEEPEPAPAGSAELGTAVAGSVDEATRQIVEAPDPWIAAADLVGNHSPAVVEALIGLLKGHDRELAALAAYTLAEIGTASARRAVLDVFPPLPGRAGAPSRWGSAGDGATRAMLELLELAREDERLRAKIAFALADIGSSDGGEALIGLLNDPSPWLPSWVGHLLAEEFSGTAPVAALLDILEADRDASPASVAAVARTIARRPEAASLIANAAGERRRRVADQLVAAFDAADDDLGDEHSDSRACLAALAVVTSAEELWLRVARTGERPEPAVVGAYALVLAGAVDPSAMVVGRRRQVVELLVAHTAVRGAVRHYCEEALGVLLDPPEAVRLARGSGLMEIRSVRESIVALLGRFGTDECVDTLAEMLARGDVYDVPRALAASGNPRALAPLARHLMRQELESLQAELGYYDADLAELR